MSRALPSNKHPASEFLDLGRAQHRAGEIAKAERNYRRALGARPGDPAALHLLGVAAFDNGRPERALQLIDKALRREPGNPDYLHAAGRVLRAMDRHDEAVARYRAALAADASRVATRLDLGNVLKHGGRLDEAAQELRVLLEAAPDLAEAWSNLGLVEKARGHFGDAVACFERAAALRPDMAAFPYNLANLLAEVGRYADAADAYRQAIARDPRHAGAHVGLGAALRRAGALTDACTALEHALTLHPDNAEARWNLALARLMGGDWAEGFAAFEARLALPGYRLPALPVPRWDGQPVSGQTLLVAHEQGFGDALQFLRFAADAADQGAYVIYRGPAALLPLAARIDGVGATAALDAPLPACDLWLPMMSLPHVLGAAAAQRLGRAGYLVPEDARVTRWRERLSGVGGLRIGIGWQGNPAYGADRERSILLHRFEALARVPGVTLIALQKGAGTEQLRQWPPDLPLVNLGPELDGDGAAFMDTAAVLPSLDLVITSDTALAHLAGAVGVPTWLALARVPDWRWGLESAHTVWYPTVHVFRQRHPGDWTAVFEDMTEALRARIGIHG